MKRIDQAPVYNRSDSKGSTPEDPGEKDSHEIDFSPGKHKIDEFQCFRDITNGRIISMPVGILG
ncbi:MAG: hypothetical protein ACWGSD_18765, partial [Thermodesulfobacteriota bacterium]